MSAEIPVPQPKKRSSFTYGGKPEPGQAAPISKLSPRGEKIIAAKTWNRPAHAPTSPYSMEDVLQVGRSQVPVIETPANAPRREAKPHGPIIDHHEDRMPRVVDKAEAMAASILANMRIESPDDVTAIPVENPNLYTKLTKHLAAVEEADTIDAVELFNATQVVREGPQPETQITTKIDSSNALTLKDIGSDQEETVFVRKRPLQTMK